jgi:hypothetical protein
MDRSIAHAGNASPIPDATPTRRLRALLRRYADPDLPVPKRYRVAMLARIAALLLATSARDGHRRG